MSDVPSRGVSMDKRQLSLLGVIAVVMALMILGMQELPAVMWSSVLRVPASLVTHQHCSTR